MLRYIGSRVLVGGLTAFLVLVFVFVVARLTGDPFEIMYPDGVEPEQIERLNEQYGLDRSYPEQFWLYLQGFAQGDFGTSLVERRPVEQVFFPRLVETLKLGTLALTVSLVVGTLLGAVTALYPKARITKGIGQALSMLYAVPGFIVALVLLLVFSYTLDVLPSTGASTPAHYVMPVICLSIGPIVTVARTVENSMREAMPQDYIMTAISKGVGKARVLTRHIFPNSLIPVVTQVGLIVAGILSGTMVVEAVFSWPGMGDLLVKSALRRDFPLIQFAVVAVAALVIALNFILDVIYMLLDPRIGKSRGA